MVRFTRRVVAPMVVALAMLATPADAGEFGAFFTLPTPTENWKTGFGFHAAFIGLPFVQAGVEWARMGGEDTLLSISTYTGQAEFSPPSLKISPFVGVGVGAYKQNDGTASDWGSLTTIYGGLRVPIGAAKLRAEVRKLSLSGTPRANIDKRFSLGVSFHF